MPDEPRRIENAREAFIAEVDALRERVQNVHLETPCPRCGAPLGQRCRRVQRPHTGAGPAPAGLPAGPTLKHPHDQRIRAAGIALR